jgi:tetratricopeptide (TPR) repeat protein
MKPHAFVAMPFGLKSDADGQPIDFNRVYLELLRPALEMAGCEVFRADEEQQAGDIRKDMFQELLVADLVLADLTIDNPNVWYELGVRHALRARGVILVQGPRRTNPFDIYTDRKLHYGLKDGAPDPARLDADRTRIAEMARATLESSTRRRVSPVYALLPNLEQPQWQRLLVEGSNEFSDGYQRWKSKVEVARQKNRPGDILVLADETPTRSLWREAKRDAGNSLLKLQQVAFALEQFEAVLEVDPDDPVARAKRITCLGRLEKFEEAEEAARRLTEATPDDPEAWALAGRAAKDRWLARWRQPGLETAELRQAAGQENASLDGAIEPYHKAFIANPSHFYSGINSLTLHLLLKHLGGEVDETMLDNLVSGVAWSTLSAVRRNPKDYWAKASFAELSLLVNGKEAVQADFRTAVAAANRDWFALDSTRQTLTLLRDLEYRPEETALALSIIDAEIRRATPPFTPRQVVLFSGHMVDAPDRAVPRFPAAHVPAAQREIERAIDALGVGPDDLVLTQGAAGGDMLFAEACLARGARVQFLLPLAEPEFIDQSILRSADGARWRERWFAIKAKVKDKPRVMPEELGPLPKGVNAFERCNLWLLNTALAYGLDKVRFVCLWDGGGGDGPGGTRHMRDEVKRRTGRVDWIDARKLAP